MAKASVLYVEDEPFLGRIVKESLESRNFEVHMVTDGALAVKTFERINPDICVLDIMLPHVDGYAIAKAIRQQNPSIPVIFLTAKTQTEDLLKGFESGGNDYLRKPFSMEELIVRINNLINIANRNHNNGDVLKLGKYELHLHRFELRRDDTSRKLSNREAMLLRILTENQNRTVNRKDILMKVWGDDSFFNSRNLDVYITKLRDLLKDDPSIEIITIKGVGYHIVAG